MDRRYDSADSLTAEESLVLLCIDDREHSFRAFNWYVDHFYRRQHIIGLVHIHSPPDKHGTPTSLAEDGEYQRRLAEYESKKISIVDKFRSLCIENDIRYCVIMEKKEESVGKTICEVAARHRASCIVVGPRGLGTIKRTIFGSVSDSILHHARIPLLIVPPEKKQK